MLFNLCTAVTKIWRSSNKGYATRKSYASATESGTICATTCPRGELWVVKK